MSKLHLKSQTEAPTKTYVAAPGAAGLSDPVHLLHDPLLHGRHRLTGNIELFLLVVELKLS